MNKQMNKPIFTMLVGLPGSGKSTYANRLSKSINAIICSSDKIREEICGDENSQQLNNKVFSILHKRIKNNLYSGNNVIYDATNIHSKRRRAFISELKNINCFKQCIVIATPYFICLEMNKKRTRTVPESVIEKMYKSFDMPYWFEGWDHICFNYTKFSSCTERNREPFDFVSDTINYNQENSHHKLTLGEHLLKTLKYSFEIIDSEFYCNEKSSVVQSVHEAALLHDLGKPFTKTFINCKGEKTNDAHYYGHEHVGAYDSMFFKSLLSSKRLDVAILINLHMFPYLWKQDEKNTEKLKEKYRKIWGDKLFEKVMMIHKADVLAH